MKKKNNTTTTNKSKLATTSMSDNNNNNDTNNDTNTSESRHEEDNNRHDNNTNEEELKLLKIDVEGYELYAFRGLGLERYPFQYILFEFFPQLIQASGVSDPVEVLEFVILSNNYQCIQGWSSKSGFQKGKSIGENRQELQQWANKVNSHTNVFCRRR